MLLLSSPLLAGFREVFKLPDKNVLHWFPGHMGKGLRQMEQKLRSVDCVIEVHDARIPLSGRNLKFIKSFSGPKPHILVLNKKDLADTAQAKNIEQELLKTGITKVIFTNCKNHFCSGVKSIIPSTVELLSNQPRYNRTEEYNYTLMIVGVSNVGKSSLINVLRNIYLKQSNAAHVGAVPGITRSVQTKIKISQDPLIYLFDTPGILPPHVTNVTAGLKLALISSLQDHLVGTTIIADYLLFWLNKQKNFKYVEYFKMDSPSDQINEVLYAIAFVLKKSLRVRTFDGYKTYPDLEFAAAHFLKTFRTGEFGKVILDNF